MQLISFDHIFTNGTVRKGDKIKAKAFPYAPWDFNKAGTYHGGRLLKKFKQ